MACSEDSQLKIVSGEAGYVLEDVPHLTDFFPDLPVFLSLFALLLK
jgi:6-phosphofructokinase 1